MAIEVGQYWKHDNGISGMSIWRIESLLNPGAGQDALPVILKLISSIGGPAYSGGEPTTLGQTIEYTLEFDEVDWWTRVEEEDIPLHILGDL